MSNFINDSYAQILHGIMYPFGETYTDDNNEIYSLNPHKLGANDYRDAHMQASMQEDARLRSLLGSKRGKRKGENVSNGSYSLSWYPGQEMDIEMAPGRVLPPDALLRMSPKQREAWKKKMEQWQQQQRALVPQHGSGFISNMIDSMGRR